MNDKNPTTTIFISEDYPVWAKALLQTEWPNFKIIQAPIHSLLNRELSGEDIQGLLVRSTSKVDEKLLEVLPNLKIVGTATSGFDHLSLKNLSAKNIITFHTPTANADATADLTLWHILTSLRSLSTLQQQDIKWRSDLSRGKNALGLSLGILGMGQIGRRVAQRAQAFGMQIFYHDPYVDQEDLIKSPWDLKQPETMGLLELFTHCDVISLHLPLTQKTQHIINEKTLEHFGTGKALINCARGELVHTSSLLKALDSGVLDHAGLDTFEAEPLDPQSILRKHPKVQWTPHIGAYTEQAFVASCKEAVLTLSAFFKHKTPPAFPLPPAADWAEDI